MAHRKKESSDKCIWVEVVKNQKFVCQHGHRIIALDEERAKVIREELGL